MNASMAAAACFSHILISCSYYYSTTLIIWWESTLNDIPRSFIPQVINYDEVPITRHKLKFKSVILHCST